MLTLLGTINKIFMGMLSYRSLQMVASILLAIALLYLLLKDQELSHVFAAIRGIDAPTILTCLLFLSFSQLLRIVRWWWMLRAMNNRLKLSSCFSPYLISVAVNSLVPFRLGDVYRVLGFRKYFRISGSEIFGTLLCERFLDLIVLILFLLVGVYGIADAFILEDVVSRVVIIGLIVMLFGVFTVLLYRWMRRYAIKENSNFKSSLSSSQELTDNVDNNSISLMESYQLPETKTLGQRISLFLLSLEHNLKPKKLFPLLLLSLASWMCSVAVYYLVALAITGGIDWRSAFFTISTANFGVILPSPPASIGTFDYFAALGLLAYGVSKTAAAAFALVMHVILWVPVSIAGGICFIWRAKSSSSFIGKLRETG